MCEINYNLTQPGVATRLKINRSVERITKVLLFGLQQAMSSTIQLGTLLKERHQQRMLPVVTASYLPYKREVDYRGFNEAIKVTLASYHRSGMQDASISN